MKKYKQVTTELTFRCNAKCPACHRQKPLRINLNDPKYTYTLESFQKVFYPDFLKNLDWLVLNGNFGDSIMNREFRDIISYVKQYGVRLNIHTNGGIHDSDYWKDVGNILTSSDIINFALDGLQDTHSTYRINTTFDKVFENAKAIISTKRPQVHWKYIVFDYNQHQIEEARNLAISENFTSFNLIKTGRFFAAPSTGDYVHTKKITDLTKLPKKIHCSWDDWDKWYISPDGLVFRCCWTGAHYYDKDVNRFYYPTDFENIFNAANTPLENIISYKYWEKLRTYLQGYDRSFQFCKQQCGKVISSREKIEENLSTGAKTIFEAGQGR
jgi:hypothetical protein